jgi:hypothetical protein
MSNHHHLVATDPRGALPNFLREFHRTLALGIKVLRKWDGSVWDHEKSSVVELRTEQAVVEELAYCMANPVAAGAVRHAHQWPGINLTADQLGRMSWTVRRPDLYFDPDNPQWPAVATLRLTMPSLEVTDSWMRHEVAVELSRLETEAHDAMRRAGSRFHGPEAVLARSPYDRAMSREPVRHRNPSFAVGRSQRDAFFAAVIALRAFRKAYRIALQAWRTGVREVLFPAGTWLMQWTHGASIAPLQRRQKPDSGYTALSSTLLGHRQPCLGT